MGAWIKTLNYLSYESLTTATFFLLIGYGWLVCGQVDKGKVPPAFTLKDQDGKTVSLSKFKGKPVVLYFYPADETPGCTKQVQINHIV